MDYQYPLTALHKDGESRVFYDADSFRSFAYDRANGGVGGYWMECYETSLSGKQTLRRVHSEEWLRYWSEGAKNNWIVRDNRGRVVDKKHFALPRYDSRSRWTMLWNRRDREKVHAAENGLPIPYLYSHKRGYRRRNAWSKNGKNGVHNQNKGLKLYEDAVIKNRDFDDL